MNYQPSKILIIRLGSVGDVVRTLPALGSLRERFPSAYIAWLVEEKAKGILEGNPDLDRIILFPRKKLVKGFIHPFTFLPTLIDPLRFIRELRRMTFDLVLDFHGILKSGLISFLSGATHRVGFSRGFCKELNYIFNNYHVNPKDKRLNRIEKNLALISALGIRTAEPDPIIPASEDDRRKIEAFFMQHMAGNHRPLVALHPGTSPDTPYKRWDEERYAKVADTLIEKYHVWVILTWGLDERLTVEKIARQMKHAPLIACETENLRQLAEIFRRCSLYIGSDTGPMHIAAAVRTPVVALFGPTDHRVNAPSPRNRNIIVRKDLACSPCREFRCASRECMEAVTPEEVLDAAIELLNLQPVH
ncbi:MAG: glycosyltransferase family 9 protein [Proteobacteria bacterium]|nr:glycosyltransferase family 9 protein [Pseudomonadota bacterium]